jgi:hypothetical protein
MVLTAARQEKMMSSGSARAEMIIASCLRSEAMTVKVRVRVRAGKRE